MSEILELFDRAHELFEYKDGWLVRKITINGQAKIGDIAVSKWRMSP